jgi:hypothetical protein
MSKGLHYRDAKRSSLSNVTSGHACDGPQSTALCGWVRMSNSQCTKFRSKLRFHEDLRTTLFTSRVMELFDTGQATANLSNLSALGWGFDVCWRVAPYSRPLLCGSVMV